MRAIRRLKRAGTANTSSHAVRNIDALAVTQDDPDVLEVWNLVFMQFNREPSGELRPLPAKSVDTGMGFERLVSVLQDKRSNYDTDVFAPIFDSVQRLTGCPPYQGLLGEADVDRRDTAYRVVADHIRTLSFAIADGALPSNEGRGYVLRRILRRAVRYGRQMLGAKEGFFVSLVPSVVDTLGTTFPELAKKRELIESVIAEEEQAFSSMLSRGIKEFNSRAAEIKAAGEDTLDGKAAFFLYDSMGFPLDLTELMAREAGLAVDSEGFAEAMAAQKARSAAAAKARKGGGMDLALGPEQIAWLGQQKVPFTDDDDKYELHAKPTASVRAIYSADGFVDEANAEMGMGLGIVLDKTSFYAQGGGQVADSGSIVVEGGTFDVRSVQLFGGYILHIGELSAGSLSTGTEVVCEVDYDRRLHITRSHTLTHMINYALTEVLGDGVSQKGSLVDEFKARFDFSHGKALTGKQLQQVEGIVKASVESSLPVHTQMVPLDKAMEINNLRAVFGESYPDPVRVVSIGPSVEQLLADPAKPEWEKYSIELCGGNHVDMTAGLENFALVEEAAVAKGIRRVVGVTGELASAAVASGEELRSRLNVMSASVPSDAAGIQSLREELTQLKQDVDGATTSAHVKIELREREAALAKKLQQAAKKLQQAVVDRAANEALREATEVVKAGQQYTVIEVQAVMDMKGLQTLVQRVLKETGSMAHALRASAFTRV